MRDECRRRALKVLAFHTDARRTCASGFEKITQFGDHRAQHVAGGTGEEGAASAVVCRGVWTRNNHAGRSFRVTSLSLLLFLFISASLLASSVLLILAHTANLYEYMYLHGY